MALFLLKSFSFCDCLPTAAEVMRSALVSPPTMVWGAFLRNCSHEFSPFTLVWRNYLAFDTLSSSLLYGWIFTVDVTLKFSCRCEPVRFPLLYGWTLSPLIRLNFPHTLVWLKFLAVDTLFPSLLYGWIFLRFATSKFSDYSVIIASYPSLWYGGIFSRFATLNRKNFFSHYGMVEFFRQMQHQTVKFFAFSAPRALPSIPLHLKGRFSGKIVAPKSKISSKFLIWPVANLPKWGSRIRKVPQRAFDRQQAGNPLFCLIGNFMVRIGGKYVEALDLCAEKC